MDAMQTKIAGKADKVDIANAEDIASGTAGKFVDAAGLASALSVGGGFSVFQSGPVFVGLGARIKLTGFASPVFDTYKAFSSGRFTAAFPGIYLFEVYAATKQTWGNYTADAVSILFYKNGAVYRELAEYASTFSDGRTTIQKVLLMQLAKDDYIEFGLSHYFATGGADFNYSVSGVHLA